jgi:hypothetical protein
MPQSTLLSSRPAAPASIEGRAGVARSGHPADFQGISMA